MRTSIYSSSESQVLSRSTSGFTLIEILVTLGILAILSSVMVGYSAESGRQTFLLLTQESIVQLFNLAKSDSLAAYSIGASEPGNPSETTCGYGVYVQGNTLGLFESRAADCNPKDPGARTDYSFSPSDGDIPLTGSLDSYTIDTTKLKFASSTASALKDVVFTSPNEQTYINGDTSGNAARAGVSLELIGNTNDKIEVDLNNDGQITW